MELKELKELKTIVFRFLYGVFLVWTFVFNSFNSFNFFNFHHFRKLSYNCCFVNILSLAILRDGLGMPSGWLRVHCKQFSCKHPISILNFDTLTRFPTGVWVSHPHIAKQETIQPKLNSTTKHTLFGSVKVSKSKCYNIDLFQAILRSR